jgi:hypothetical protein
MPRFKDEITLSVADYMDEYGEDDCFYLCEKDTPEAIRTFKAEAKAAGIILEDIRGVRFIEFDSNNPHHAGAYFEVDYIADKSVWWQEDCDSEE